MLLMIVQLILMVCLCLLSCCGNFSVLFTLFRRQYLLTPSNKLVFSLSLSNFAFSCLVLPFMIVSSIENAWPAGKAWCFLTGFFTSNMLGASMLTLAVISFDRYYAVVYPLKYPSCMTSCRVISMIVLCWLLATSVSLPPLFGTWSYYQFHEAQMGCFPMWSVSKSFSAIWLSICFILPFCVMLTSYFCIFRIAWTKRKHVCKINVDRFSAPKINNLFVENENSCRRVRHLDNLPCLTSLSKPVSSNTFGLKSEMDPSVVVGKPPQSIDSGIVRSSRVALQTSAALLPHQVSDCDFDRSSCSTSHNSTNNNNAAKTLCSNMLVGSAEKISVTVSVHRNPPLSKEPENLARSNRGTANPSSGRSSLNENGETTEDFIVSTQCSKPAVPPLSKFSFNDAPTFLPISRNPSRSSFMSRLSGRSVNSTRSKLLSDPSPGYYSNQMKALGTVLCVVGVLFLCCAPFVVTSLYDAVQGPVGSPPKSSVDDWLWSTVTILLLFTCVYHPLIYGFWNRTLREEMRSVFCGVARSPTTRRTRVLSLTSHLKDLSLSPRLTAAIMLEGAAVATIVRPMKLDSTSLKKQSSSVGTAGSKKRMKEKREKSKCNVINVTDTSNVAVAEDALNPSFETSRIRDTCSKTTEVQRQPIEHLDFDSKYRDREQLATGLLQIDSSQLVSSELLLPSLLYSNSSAQFEIGPSENLPSHQRTDEPGAQTRKRRSDAVTTPLFDENVLEQSSSSSASYPTSNDGDYMAKLTNGRLRTSNLIHLHAKEPVKVRKWNREETIDFFAQTFAYGLMEDLK